MVVHPWIYSWMNGTSGSNRNALRSAGLYPRKHQAPIGSIWSTDIGNTYRVIGHIPDRPDCVKVERISRVVEGRTEPVAAGDACVWHITSLTKTTAVRVA